MDLERRTPEFYHTFNVLFKEMLDKAIHQLDNMGSTRVEQVCSLQLLLPESDTESFLTWAYPQLYHPNSVALSIYTEVRVGKELHHLAETRLRIRDVNFHPRDTNGKVHLRNLLGSLYVPSHLYFFLDTGEEGPIPDKPILYNTIALMIEGAKMRDE